MPVQSMLNGLIQMESEKQRVALDKHYTSEMINRYGLTLADILNFDKKKARFFKAQTENTRRIGTF
jgi:hypothetical protein